MWDETHHFVGNCTQKPVHQLFYVNDTAMSINIIINFSTNGTFPGASLILYGPDSFVKFAQNIDVLAYRTNITNITDRGLWKLSMSVSFCSFTNPIAYDMHMSVRNHFLGPPSIKDKDVYVGEKVTIDVSGLGLRTGEMCRLDLGNGQVTPWFSASSYEGNFSKPDDYMVKAQVKGTDGTTSGWSQPLTVKVGSGGSKGVGTSTGGSVIAFVLVVLLAVVAYVMSRQR
jgi:hypothetical protein